jgi:hypothetical protein
MPTQESSPDFLEFAWIWNHVQHQPTPAPHRRIARWLQARHDGGEQQADGVLPLIHERAEQLERARQIAFADGVAEIPQHTGAAHGDHVLHGLQSSTAALAEIEIDLFEFVLHLPRVVAGHLHQQFQRTAFKGDAEFLGLA